MIDAIPAGDRGTGISELHDTNAQFVAMFYALPIGMAAMLAVVLRLWPALWAHTVRTGQSRRNHTMDGARGLLTLWVLSYHLDLVPWRVVSGVELPPGTLSALLYSGFFVAPFFALTGLLFGGALIASRGELPTVRFLHRRFFRIVPAYMVSIIGIVLTAAVMSGFRLHVGPLKLLFEIARWSLFGFVERYDINGVDLARSHGMLWTLPYEIGFYLMLPLLAWGQRRVGSPAFLVVALVLIGWLLWWPFLFFAGGVVGAFLVGWRHRHAPGVLQVASVAAVAALALTVHHTSSGLQAILLAPILAGLARELPLFRPLRLKALRYVGEISYSVYVLHYPLLWVMFVGVGGPGWLGRVGVAERWTGLIGCGVVVIAAATLCYVFVERPFIALGRSWEPRVSDLVGMWSRRSADPDDTRTVSADSRPRREV